MPALRRRAAPVHGENSNLLQRKDFSVLAVEQVSRAGTSTVPARDNDQDMATISIADGVSHTYTTPLDGQIVTIVTNDDK